MANLETLYFGLGLDTEQLQKDLVKAREQIAKMQIKAELDIEIPDISVQAFQKKIDALNKQITELTNKNNRSNAGYAASEAIKAEVASLNQQIDRYKTFIERLNHIGATAGGGVDLSVSGGEQVLATIEKITAELSKFEKGVDIKLNIVGGNGTELDGQISKLNTLKAESATNHLQEELRQLANLDLTVDVNLEEAERKLRDLKEEIGELKNIDLVVTLVNDETAIANLTRLKELVDKLNMPIDIRISENAENTSISNIKQKIEEASKNLFNQADSNIVYDVNVKANEAYLIASVKSLLERHKFDVNLDPQSNFQQEIEKDIREALKNLKDKGIELKTKADADVLIKSINSALRGQEFKIGVIVTKADASKAVRKALEEAASKYSGKEAVAIAKEQALAAKREAEARLANAKALEREAKARLANAKATREETKDVSSATREHKEFGNTLRNNFNYAYQLSDMIGDTFSLYGIKRFAEQVITIGGEFEKQKIALKSILGDAVQAEVIYSQIKNLAVKSPFEFKDLTSYAKQLSAFSIPYNELFDTTKRLADISAGLGVDMGRIILAYGQVRSAAVLRGQELRQFTEAGIPLVQELANRFTELEGEVVSTGEVFDRISKRMVSFKMVQDILFDMTEEGGKFFEMQEELSESLSGKWSNLRDAYNIMLSEIAEGNSGILKGSIESITALLNHWKTFGTILGSVVTAYAIYKITLGTINVMQAASILLTKRQTTAVLANTAAVLANRGALTGGAVAILRYADSLKKLLTSIGLFGKIGLLFAVIGGVVTLVRGLRNETNKLVEELNSMADAISSKVNADINDFNRLVKTLGKTVEGTAEHTEIISEIKSKYGDFVQDVDLVSNAYENLKEKIDAVTASMMEQAKQQFLSDSRQKLIDSMNKGITDESDDIYAGFLEVYGNNSQKAEIAKNKAFERIRELLNAGFTPDDKYFSDAINRYLTKISKVEDDGFKMNIGLMKKRLLSVAESMYDYENGLKLAAETANALFKTKDNNPESLTGWRKAIEDFILKLGSGDIADRLKLHIPKQDSGTLREWAQGILKLYDETLKDMREYESIQKNAPSLLNEKEMSKTENNLKAYKTLIDQFHLEMFREEKGGGGGVSEDPIADKWKERVRLLEDAISTYKKWKEVEGKDAAMERVKGQDVFKDIFSDANLANILEDPASVWKYIQSQLGGTEGQRKLSLELGVKVAEGSYEKMKADVEHNLDKLKAELERSATRWDIYKDLLKAGIDKGTASNIAGGISFDSMVDEWKTRLSKELEGSGISVMDALGGADVGDLPNARAIEHLVDKIRTETNKLNEDTAKSIAELVVKYRDFEQQIEEIDRQRDEDILKIKGMNIDDDEKHRLINERTRTAEEEKAKVKFEEFKRTSDWVKVFDDLDRVSTKTLDNMITKIEEFIGSGIESEEVLKQVIEALRKAKDEFSERNPFMSVSKAVVNLGDAYEARRVFKTDPRTASYNGILNGEEDDAIKNAKRDIEKAFEQISSKFKELSDVIGSVSDVLESFGDDSLTALADIIDSMASGLSTGSNIGGFFGGAGGMLGGVAGAIVGMFSGIYKSAEAATQKEIEASDARRAEMETYRDVLKSVIDKSLTGLYNLGLSNSTREKLEKLAADYETRRKAYGYDINSNNIMARFEDDANFPWETDRRYAYSGETERRIQQALEENNPYLAQLALLLAERDEYAAGHLKDSDFKAKIEEYNAQIEDLTTSLMSELYSINFEDWASRLADSIVNAWASGEDAVEAYKDTVEDMLRDVATSMVQQQVIGAYIQEHLSPLITQLIDAGGKVDENFFDLLAQAMAGLEGAVIESENILDVLEEAANKAGFSLKNNKDDANSLSSGIKGVTEDTANLLASYLNAMRQDLSVQRATIVKFVDDLFPKSNVLCQAQLQQLNMIQQNTKITADKITELNSNFNAVLNGTKKVSVK